jgi:hypothetical protein
MRQRIVYTRHDGGVTVNCPAPEIFRELQSGAWACKPNGFVDQQVFFGVKDGRDPDGVKRFCQAMVKGGVTERDVWALIRDRDCLHKGTLHELYDVEDLPDRWFRGAWSRSRNGGPIGIDLEKAKPIQWNKARQAVADENKRREEAFDPLPLIAPPWETLRSAMRHARDHDELRRVWPL